MAEDDHGRPGPGDLQTPFLFVPHGDPLPLDWMARHPGWVKFPATMVPRRPEVRGGTGVQAQARPAAPLATPIMDAATLGMTAGGAAAIPSALDAGGTAAVMAAPLAVPLAPELVLVLVLVGGILVWRYMTREQARSLKAQAATPLPPLLPADPGLVPPPIAPDRPADAGLPPAPPIPDLPGLPQADPVPHVLATPASDQGETNVFHNRNEGVPPSGARTYSSRARKGARASDPMITGALKDDEWRAHHLFAVAVAKRFPKVVAAAVRAGWRMDGPSNMAALPASPDAQTKLHEEMEIERPVHDSGHPKWNAAALKVAEKIVAKLEELGLVEGSAEYDQAARKAMEAAEKGFRRTLRGLKRMTQNDHPASEAQT